MRGRYRLASLVAALVCGLALVACGGGDDGTDVDALTGCLEDAGLEVESDDVEKEESDQGITDELSAGSADAAPDEKVQIGVFDSADDAEKFVSDFSGDLKQVDSVLIFSLDTDSKDYDQTVSCAEEATG